MTNTKINDYCGIILTALFLQHQPNLYFERDTIMTKIELLVKISNKVNKNRVFIIENEDFLHAW